MHYAYHPSESPPSKPGEAWAVALGFVRVICLHGGVRITPSGVGVGVRGGTVRPSAVDTSDLGDCSTAVVGVDYDFDGGDVGAPQDLLVLTGTSVDGIGILHDGIGKMDQADRDRWEYWLLDGC
jgi:hypothetical protein